LDALREAVHNTFENAGVLDSIINENKEIDVLGKEEEKRLIYFNRVFVFAQFAFEDVFCGTLVEATLPKFWVYLIIQKSDAALELTELDDKIRAKEGKDYNEQFTNYWISVVEATEEVYSLLGDDEYGFDSDYTENQTEEVISKSKLGQNITLEQAEDIAQFEFSQTTDDEDTNFAHKILEMENGWNKKAVLTAYVEREVDPNLSIDEQNKILEAELLKNGKRVEYQKISDDEIS